MSSYTLVLALRVEGRAAVDGKNLITTSAMNTSAAADRYTRNLIRMVQRELKACEGGSVQGNLYASIIDSTATLDAGAVACTQANAAGNFVRFTYGGIQITLTEGVDFARGASDTTCAAALAAAINAHAILGKEFLAANSTGTCNFTSKIASAVVRNWVLTTDDATAFGLTQLTGGTAGAAQFALQHFPLNRTP